MNELNKTAIYFAVALATVALAVFTQPRSGRFDVETMVGEPLLDEFEMDAPRRLAIASVDPETGEQLSFEVAENKGLWTIPSKSGYPADATERMVAAVEGLAGREILAVATDDPGRHAEFGVLDPSASESAIDAESVGTRVKLTDADDKTLADVIIGKEVKDTDGQQRYVRVATQDAVYAAEIDLGSFTTDFGDWIEKDLLQLSTFDVQTLRINDYSASAELVFDGARIRPQLTYDRRGKYQVTFDDESSTWNPDSLESYEQTGDEYLPFELSPSEELDADSLRELKNALDDLTIVDVDRKPTGLSADLKAGADFLNSENDAALQSLVAKGFLPVGGEGGGLEILSSNGELIVTLNNGVEYVLRFGDLKRGGDGTAVASSDTDDAADEESLDNEDGVNRYLFVLARMNEAAVERPVLEELPPLPDAANPDDTIDATDDTEDGESTDEAADADGDSDQEAADATSETDEADPPGEAGDSDDPSAEEQAEENRATADEIALIRQQRNLIEDRNNAALKQYETKLEEGREKVEELNLRFGDWYYVIGNDVFTKIHLGRDEIIKPVDPPAGETLDNGGAGPLVPFGGAGSPIPGLPGLPAIPADGDSPDDDATETDGDESDGEEASEDDTAGGEEPETTGSEESTESSTAEPAESGAAPE